MTIWIKYKLHMLFLPQSKTDLLFSLLTQIISSTSMTPGRRPERWSSSLPCLTLRATNLLTSHSSSRSLVSQLSSRSTGHWNRSASFRLTLWMKKTSHMIRSYYHCGCINESIIFSHCVHLPVEYLWSWRYCHFNLSNFYLLWGTEGPGRTISLTSPYKC